LARKNPCDRPADASILRGTPEPPRKSLKCLDSVEWATPESPTPDTPKRFVAPWFFKEIFKDSQNVCFVKPNVCKNELWVKITKNEPVQIVKIDEFIRLFVNHVMFRLFPRNYPGFSEYENWLYCEHHIDLNRGNWDGTIPDEGPEFIFGMRDAVRELVSAYPNRTQLKNMLVNFT
jgi:hypothetical protein